MKRFVLGMTGGIGMGKTTTSQMFAEAGIPIWDADAAVHRLYGRGGAAVGPMSEAFPQAIVEGAVDRARLREVIAADPTALPRIEKIVHPLVSADRTAFLANSEARIVILDIPLLFEGGGKGLCDGVVVVSAPADVQRARVLARGTMSEADFERIVARQMPDAEKRARADWVIETTSLEAARARVHEILSEIDRRLSDA